MGGGGFSAAPASNDMVIRQVTKSLALTGNNQTLSQNVFGLIGSVLVHKLWGLVTTVLGANHTAAHLRLEDGVATVDLSLAAGVALSALPVGSLIYRGGLVATALIAKSAAAGAFGDAPDIAASPMTPFVITRKAGASVYIAHRYATTDAPTSGVIQWYAQYEPLSSDGELVAA